MLGYYFFFMLGHSGLVKGLNNGGTVRGDVEWEAEEMANLDDWPFISTGRNKFEKMSEKMCKREWAEERGRERRGREGSIWATGDLSRTGGCCTPRCQWGSRQTGEEEEEEERGEERRGKQGGRRETYVKAKATRAPLTTIKSRMFHKSRK